MDITPEYIKSALAGSLLGMASHQKMMPPNRRLKVANRDKRTLKPSSVMLLLFEEKGELFICLIKRPLTMTHHAGQIAFPGGRIDPGETVLETALRETWEEIGIPPEEIEVLGSLTELFIDVSGYLIQPFVGWLKEKPCFKLNKSEVEKLILFPLLRFRNSFEETVLVTITGRLSVPCIKYDGDLIWGATAMILSEFYDALEEGSTLE